MDPFIFIEKKSIPEKLCMEILSIEDEDIPLYPEESSSWFSIINRLLPILTHTITEFIDKQSLEVYNMHNIIENSILLQTNMVIYRKVDELYHNDFNIIDTNHSTLSYFWCLGPSVEVTFGKSYTKHIEQGDLVIFPASWEYPYKLDSQGIYLKGTLYTSYE